MGFQITRDEEDRPSFAPKPSPIYRVEMLDVLGAAVTNNTDAEIFFNGVVGILRLGG